MLDGIILTHFQPIFLLLYPLKTEILRGIEVGFSGGIEVWNIGWKCVNKNSNPSRPNPGRREKIKLNFYFHTSLWCLKK